MSFNRAPPLSSGHARDNKQYLRARREGMSSSEADIHFDVRQCVCTRSCYFYIKKAGENCIGESALGEYQTKPLRCEAHRWNASEPPDNWPSWLRSAITDTRHRLSGQASLDKSRLRIKAAYGYVTVEDGDWVVYWSGSRQELEVFSPEDFHRKFDPAIGLDDNETPADISAKQALRELHARRPK